MMSRRGGQSGFALVEVLVALTLLAVGLVTVLSASLAALNLQKDTTLRWRAGLLLDEKLADTYLQSTTAETAQGVSADGVFHWLLTSRPWGEPAESETESKDSGAAVIQNLVLREITIEVRWETARGVRSISASQVITASATGGAS